jgi:hypothetical protein
MKNKFYTFERWFWDNESLFVDETSESTNLTATDDKTMCITNTYADALKFLGSEGWLSGIAIYYIEGKEGDLTKWKTTEKIRVVVGITEELANSVGLYKHMLVRAGFKENQIKFLSDDDIEMVIKERVWNYPEVDNDGLNHIEYLGGIMTEENYEVLGVYVSNDCNELSFHLVRNNDNENNFVSWTSFSTKNKQEILEEIIG